MSLEAYSEWTKRRPSGCRVTKDFEIYVRSIPVQKEARASLDDFENWSWPQVDNGNAIRNTAATGGSFFTRR